MEDEVLARISASPARRVMGVLSMGALGVILVYVGFARPPDSFAWQIVLIVFGVAALFLADRMRRATAEVLELTRTELRSTDGTVIARVEEIEHLDRGFFAFKPSNGFLMRLSTKKKARWEPGLWWCLGRRVGIGGVTPGSQSKAMAEIMAALMHQRSE
ncbi:hypothetical protein FDP25_13575 [Roseovarius sp. A21]|uniref:Uncharacterized protein n=1 Tax=Roseovarius bejariae TaxID=2576383 RepID=A0A844CNR6_9RHOB|nr:hypothetical protein [Roseovarius bejariae]MRU16467.1 hypothetical protein [Roseovarius bejariae]